MKLRLAYMTGEYPRATDTFIQREVARLRALGHEVDTFSIRRPPTEEIVSDAVRTEREKTFYVLGISPVAFLTAHVALLFTSPVKYFGGLALAMRIRPPGAPALLKQVAYFAEAGVVAWRMRKLGIPHLHNHFSDSSCSVAMIAAEMGAFTFSFTMHGPGEFFEPMHWRINEKIRRALFVNCISYFCRSQAMVFAPVEMWPKLHVVHCGVDPEEFAARSHSGEGSRLLFVGRLAAAKGIPVLLEAMIQLPTASLTIAGDGPDRGMLERLVVSSRLTSRVKFLGYQSQEQIKGLLKEADVFVMASFAEGLPVVLMEAMAAGLPVVATRIAGVAELVEEGVNGLLVPPGDSTALVRTIEKLLSDGEMRERFAEAGRAKVQREFNLQKEVRRLARIFTAAFEGRGETIRPVETDAGQSLDAAAASASARQV